MDNVVSMLGIGVVGLHGLTHSVSPEPAGVSRRGSGSEAILIPVFLAINSFLVPCKICDACRSDFMIFIIVALCILNLINSIVGIVSLYDFQGFSQMVLQ